MLSLPEADEGDRRRRFEELYTAHQASLLGYALRRTRSSDDAADVLAETFLAAWRRIEVAKIENKGRGFRRLRIRIAD